MEDRFREYVAAAKINIGLDTENSIVVRKGTVVRYDGTTAIIEGKEYNFPRLVSAIKARWLVSTEELGVGATTNFRPESARIKMRGATPGQQDVVATNATYMEEDREISSVQAFRDGEHQVAPTLQDNEGDVISFNFQTAAGSRSSREFTRVDQLSQNAIRSIEDGDDGSSKAASLAEVERQRMEREIARLREELQAAQEEPAEGQGQLVQTAEGDEDNDRDVAEPLTEEAEREAKIAQMRILIPDFEWDFEAHWRTKVKTLEEAANPIFIRAVHTLESEAMQKQIEKRFPEVM